MPGTENYKGQSPAWCPGCGNFAILKAFNDTMASSGIRPHEVVLVSGIGQAAKLPHYSRANVFNGLHGRALPVATGIKLGNHSLRVIVTTGDGDCYGEGGNHLIHAIRRNVDIKVFVHDNQIYGLTKGQASPTSMAEMHTKAQPFGGLSEQMNPLLLAVSLNAGFVARGFAGDSEHLKEMMGAALNHRGFALLDILQPCVTFNKLNTYEWYKSRVYRVGKEHDPEDRIRAFERALEWGDRIPIGIIYRRSRPTFEELSPVLREGALANRTFDKGALGPLLKEFF